MLDYHCPVDMRRGACLGEEYCHLTLDAAQGKLNCRVHRGNVRGNASLGVHATRKDTKVFKGHATRKYTKVFKGQAVQRYEGLHSRVMLCICWGAFGEPRLRGAPPLRGT